MKGKHRHPGIGTQPSPLTWFSRSPSATVRSYREPLNSNSGVTDNKGHRNLSLPLGLTFVVVFSSNITVWRTPLQLISYGGLVLVSLNGAFSWIGNRESTHRICSKILSRVIAHIRHPQMSPSAFTYFYQALKLKMRLFYRTLTDKKRFKGRIYHFKNRFL